MTAFFEMGGYAGFIWPAYGAVTVVLVGLMALSRRALKAAETELPALDPRQTEQENDEEEDGQ